MGQNFSTLKPPIIPVWWSHAVGNNGNAAKNGCPLTKDILRADLRCLHQVVDSLPACVVKVGVDYHQDHAHNCIRFRDGS